MINEGRLSKKTRKQADKHFYKMCRANGMGYIRAKIWYQGVRIGAKYFSKYEPKEIREAP